MGVKGFKGFYSVQGFSEGAFGGSSLSIRVYHEGFRVQGSVTGGFDASATGLGGRVENLGFIGGGWTPGNLPFSGLLKSISLSSP